MTTEASIKLDLQTQQLTCQGEWRLSTLPALQKKLNQITWPSGGTLTINGSAIQDMDSSGAWLLLTLCKKLRAQNSAVELQDFSEQQQKLLSMLEGDIRKATTVPPYSSLNWLARVGKHTVQQCYEARDFLAFIGQLTLEVLRLIREPVRIRWRALFSTIERTGYQALPIIALLSFMIGVVITYQMGLQLKTYGANIFIVELLGLGVLREFGPLLTAIMVAGRTGSAFTAQLGTMKLNAELDALNTMGITPGELLLLPRLVGLVITLPLLTMWADIFGIIGGIIMSKSMLNISWYDFLDRFQQQIPVNSFLIGICKAPVFALLIGAIGCFQGLQTQNTADSIGKQTTKSVVLAIFFIIVADAIFSVVFSKLGI
jgi:phospholipid/cholesterol/gamma-HCH transport system permease protein